MALASGQAQGKRVKPSKSKKAKSGYEGDIKIRCWLNSEKSKRCKYAAPGHTTLSEVLEFARADESVGIMDGIGDVHFKAGHEEGQLRAVAASERIGNLIDPKHGSDSTEKPYVYVEFAPVKEARRISITARTNEN